MYTGRDEVLYSLLRLVIGRIDWARFELITNPDPLKKKGHCTWSLGMPPLTPGRQAKVQESMPAHLLHNQKVTCKARLGLARNIN